MARSTKPKKSGATRAALFRDRVKGLARLPAARIEGAAKNFRTHDDRQRGALDGVLAEVGIAGAAVAWIPDDAARAALAAVDGPEAFAAWLASFTGNVRLIDGHLRRECLAAQGQPVLVTDLDEREAAKALATFDAVSDLAGVDAELLASLLADVGKPEEDGTADLLAELQKRIPASARGDDEEEEPVIPTDALVKKWSTASGQLWAVPSLTVPGREHRLLCGDCRDPANVERLRGRRLPRLGLHDPPYGIAIVSRTGSTLGDGRPIAKRPLGNGERTRGGNLGNGERARTEWTRRGKFAPIEGDAGDFDAAHLLGTAHRVVLWGANNFPSSLPPSNDWIVWDKKATTEGHISANSFSDFELAFVSPVPGKTGHTRMIRHLWSGLIRASEKGEQRLHPTQKPIAVQRQIVEWYTEPGDDVEDWYMGAGAVIIACEQTGRIGHGMDIAHAYLAATLERLAARGLSPRLCLSSEVP